MKVRQKSVPAFIVGLISAILSLVGSLLSILGGLGLGLVVNIPLLLLPSILILIGSIICLFKAKVGGIIISIAFGLYTIGIIIGNIGFGIVSIMAFPLIMAALILSFIYPKLPKIVNNMVVGTITNIGTGVLKVKVKALPAFIFGLLGSILGLVGSILSILSGGIIISVIFLLLPSLLVFIGSIICLIQAKVGGIIIAIAYGFYTIGIIIKCFGFSLVSVIAFPLVLAALLLAFLSPKVKKKEKSTNTNPAPTANTVPTASYEQPAISAAAPVVNYAQPAISTGEPVEGTKVTYAPLFSAGVNSLSVLGLIFSFFMPILGLLFGLTGMHDAKYHAGRGRGMGLTAAVISVFMTLILIPILMFSLVLR